MIFGRGRQTSHSKLVVEASMKNAQFHSPPATRIACLHPLPLAKPSFGWGGGGQESLQIWSMCTCWRKVESESRRAKETDPEQCHFLMLCMWVQVAIESIFLTVCCGQKVEKNWNNGQNCSEAASWKLSETGPGLQLGGSEWFCGTSFLWLHRQMAVGPSAQCDLDYILLALYFMLSFCQMHTSDLPW